ncbi:MAG: helix-turn-helix domain-containing protein [Myxococcota bacterium]|nr:helix-turn-helix domain-containing protein [Myxococcota bacterium]
MSRSERKGPAEAPAAPPRRRRSPEEARRQILDAAEKLLVEGGPEAIRLQDVARDVGIAHPTILHHFGSREGMVLALERRAMERLRDELMADREASSEDVLDRVFRVLGDQGYARLLAWSVLSGLPAETGTEFRMLEELGEAYHSEQSREAGIDIEETVFRVRLAAVALFGEALLGPLLSRSAGLDDPEDEVRTRFRHWLARLIAGEEE